jgi:betaine-aldehyde dehydrogenase
MMTSTTTAPVAAVARHWIDGKWVTSATIAESINPSTGEVLGSYNAGGAPEAQAAIDAARRAFDTTEWSRDARHRAKALNELADRIEVRTSELAAMLSHENGKLLWETGWEVATTVSWLRYSAATALTQMAGRAAETAPGAYFHSTPEPLGVAGVITPWNSPVILTARAIGPALAAGCTVVVKLPGQTALTNGLLAEVIAETSSLPAGVVNLFTEIGNEGAPLLVESPKVNVLSYTGSTVVGRRIAEAGGRMLKRLNLELGGKTPLIIFDDADLDAALPVVVRAAVMMNGQFCVTGSRVLVHRAVADTVRERLSAALEAIQVGPSHDPTSQLGPLIDAASATRVDQLVEDALAYAKPLVRGGLVTDGPLAAAGAFYRPSLLEVEDVNTPLVQQETFGPVQTFEIFDDETDAITKANATEYGLAAAIFTADSGRARRIGRAIETAIVWINTWGLLHEDFEQGGFKHSGNGYLCGPHAIEQFQQLKVYAEAAITTSDNS